MSSDNAQKTPRREWAVSDVITAGARQSAVAQLAKQSGRDRDRRIMCESDRTQQAGYGNTQTECQCDRRECPDADDPELRIERLCPPVRLRIRRVGCAGDTHALERRRPGATGEKPISASNAALNPRAPATTELVQMRGDTGMSDA